MAGTPDVAVRRRSRRRRPRRTFPDRLHIVSLSFRRDGPHPRRATVPVRGTMGQDEAMRVARRRARALGPEPWLHDVNTVPPPRPTPALDAITRKHTAFPTFTALLTAAAGYYPSIRLDPMGRDGLVLAQAYDTRQARWGDPRRAYVGGDLPPRRPGAGS